MTVARAVPGTAYPDVLATPNRAATGPTASGASGGALTRSTGWPSISVTVQVTNEQQICSAAARRSNSSRTPVPGW